MVIVRQCEADPVISLPQNACLQCHQRGPESPVKFLVQAFSNSGLTLCPPPPHPRTARAQTWVRLGPRANPGCRLQPHSVCTAVKWASPRHRPDRLEKGSLWPCERPSPASWQEARSPGGEGLVFAAGGTELMTRGARGHPPDSHPISWGATHRQTHLPSPWPPVPRRPRLNLLVTHGGSPSMVAHVRMDGTVPSHLSSRCLEDLTPPVSHGHWGPQRRPIPFPSP